MDVNLYTMHPTHTHTCIVIRFEQDWIRKMQAFLSIFDQDSWVRVMCPPFLMEPRGGRYTTVQEFLFLEFVDVVMSTLHGHSAIWSSINDLYFGSAYFIFVYGSSPI